MDGSRSAMGTAGDGVGAVLAAHARISALGQVSEQQPVGVLSDAALPSAVPIAEVHP